MFSALCAEQKHALHPLLTGRRRGACAAVQLSQLAGLSRVPPSGVYCWEACTAGRAGSASSRLRQCKHCISWLLLWHSNTRSQLKPADHELAARAGRFDASLDVGRSLLAPVVGGEVAFSRGTAVMSAPAQAAPGWEHCCLKGCSCTIWCRESGLASAVRVQGSVGCASSGCMRSAVRCQ